MGYHTLVLPAIAAILIITLLLWGLITNCRTEWKAKKTEGLLAYMMKTRVDQERQNYAE